LYLRRAVFDIFNLTLKPVSGVTQGHRNQHRSIRHLWLPINIP